MRGDSSKETWLYLSSILAICVGGIFFYRNKNKMEKISYATDMLSAAKYAI